MRLIDADALITNYDLHIVIGAGDNICIDIADIAKAPAVEVVHGRWKYYRKQNIAVCTNCSFERDLDVNFGKAVSCPNCGARMDGDRNG